MAKSLLSTDEHIATIKEVLDTESMALMNLKENLQPNISEVVDVILECKGRVIVTGVGKSGLIGRKIAATLASTGTSSFFLHPSEGLHGDLGMVTDADIVLALSKSGETEEIVQMIPSIKRIGSKMIAFVGNNKSTLAKRSSNIISINNVVEACPLGLAPTTSATLMLALGDAIAIALLKAKNFSSEDFAIYHPGGLLGKRLLYTVASIMELNQRNPFMENNSKVKDVIFKMTASGMGAVSIVNQTGQLEGIITDGDIRRFLSQNENLMEITVEELYQKQPMTISKEALAVEALNVMEENNINVLPVVNDKNEPIAMIHLHDLTRLGL